MNSSWRIRQVAGVVKDGGVIAYPTEAVWGLGCDPWNEAAVRRLLALKSRPMHKGLILVAARATQFDFLLNDLPGEWLLRLADSWPGPNTWLVRALCAHTGPLVSTSANPAGRPSARSRLRVEQYFHNQLDGLLGGELGGRRNPSLIRDLATGKVIRPS